jgi:hypothetical protein
MAYCTSAQVAAEFKDITFSANTPVTDTDVDRFIAEADAEINSVLAVRYATPITGTEALIIVRQLSIDLVAERVKNIIKVRTGEEVKNQSGRSGDLAAEARKRLEALAKGTAKLTDAARSSSHYGIKSYNVANDIEPTFTKDCDAW